MLSSDEFDSQFDSEEDKLYEWDEEKRKTNILKHGLDFREVESVFRDPYRLTMEDTRSSCDEIRFKTIGMLASKIVVVVVVHTERNEVTRIISLRFATKKEKRLYNGNG
jgi:Uncharacterized protein conserved in bacteria